jgi:hypothetical protein
MPNLNWQKNKSLEPKSYFTTSINPNSNTGLKLKARVQANSGYAAHECGFKPKVHFA